MPIAALWDAGEQLYVGSSEGRGLFVRELKSWTFTAHPSRLDFAVTAIVGDGQGALFVASEYAVHHVQLQGDHSWKVTVLPMPPQAVDERPPVIRKRAHDSRRGLWVATDRGLLQSEGDRLVWRWQTEQVHVVAIGRDGMLMFGSEEQGLLRAPPGEFAPERIVPWPLDTTVHSLVESAMGDAAGGWFAGTEGGLNRVDDRGAQEVYSHAHLTDPGVRVLHEDLHHQLWIGTDAGGLLRVNLRPTITHVPVDGKPRVALSFLGAQDKSLWISFGHELLHVQDGQQRIVYPPEALRIFRMRAMAQTDDGLIWILDLDEGLVRFDGVNFTLVHRPAPGTNFHAIEAQGNALWLGSTDGKILFGRPDALSPMQGPHAAGCDGALIEEIRSDMGDSSHAVWIATAQAGLCRATPDGGIQAIALPKHGSRRFVSLLDGEDGVVWIGTEDRGLLRWDGRKLQSLGVANGLPVLQVGNLFGASDGRVLLVSRTGGFLTDRAALETAAQDSTRLLGGVPIGFRDGLRSIDMIAGFSPAAALDRDGNLWASTLGGIIQISPRYAEPPKLLPTIGFDEVLVNDSAVSVSTAFAGLVGNGAIRFRLVAPALSNAHRLRVTFRLQGYDSDFRLLPEGGVAEYRSLPAGNYRLETRAEWMGSSAVITGPVLSIALLPPYYRRPSVVILSVLAIALIVVLVWTIRRRQWQQKENLIREERKRIARDFHDTLEQTFVAVRLQLQSSEQKRLVGMEPGSHIDRALALLDDGLKQARGFIWALRGVGPVDLPSHLAQMAGEILQGTGIECQVRTEGAKFSLPQPLSSATEFITRELLTNAIKHAQAHRLDFVLSCAAGNFNLRYDDDGTGFSAARLDAAKSEGRFGLQGIEERTALQGGTMTLIPVERGTRIEFRFPIR